MTVLGKILIVLNLLAAVLVGGMLIFHAATEPNWALGTDKLQSEVTASRTSSAAKEDEVRDLKVDKDRLAGQLKTDRETFDKKKGELESTVEKLKDQVGEQEKLATKAQKVADASQAEASRLGKEVALHQATIRERNDTIHTLEGEAKKYLTRAVNAENNNQTLQARLKVLLEQNENLNKRLVKAESGGGGIAALTRSPNADNPPPVDVKGVITNIQRDRGLVEISIGSDDGVSAGHTLLVYRLKPRPEFLGKIRIVDAEHHKAVGQIMKTDAVRHSAMARGDEVASSITARNR
jgi:hypothetical protein